MGVKNIKEKLVTPFMDSPWWVLFFLSFISWVSWNLRNPQTLVKWSKSNLHYSHQNCKGWKRKKEIRIIKVTWSIFFCFKIQIHMYCLFMYKIVKSSQQLVIVKLVKSVRMCCLGQFIYFSNSNGNNIYFFDNKIGIFILLSHLVD